MDKAKKKRIKKYITWISMALVVALLTAMPLLARQEAEADGPVASVLSAEVTSGSLTATLHGGGNITAAEVEEVKLPSGVKIKEFLVKNGQFVTQGTPLATVDKVSVMTAITEVSETLDYLREELEDARDEKIGSSIKATAGGRVKKVFAQTGESVQDVMLRDGALAILSLDGLMAVKLEEKLPLTTGENVTITLADGEEVTGRVESNLDNVVIITIEDEGYEAGQTVTVSQNGEALGENTLYIHNAWKATAYTGTIESVNIKEEQTVSDGNSLFTLKDRDYEGELRRRASQHREYEELLQKLFQMYEAGVITAPCDGEVEGVDEDSAYLLSAVPDGWVIAPLNNTVSETGEKGWTVMLLAGPPSGGEVIEGAGGPTPQNGEGGQQPAVCTGGTTCTLTWDQHTSEQQKTCEALCKECNTNVAANNNNHATSCITRCTTASDPTQCPAENHYKNCIYSCTNGTQDKKCGGGTNHNPSCIEYCKSADNINTFCNATGDHKLTCIHACKRADKAANCPAEKYHDVNCIRRCSENLNCDSNKHTAKCPHYNLTYTATAGVVVRASSGTIEYKYYAGATDVTATRDLTGKFTITARPDLKLMNTTGFVNSNEACSPGDIILIVNGKTPDGVSVVANQVYVYQTAAVDIGALMGGFSMPSIDISSLLGGFSGFGNYGAVAPEDEGLFDLEGNTLLTVTPHTSATLTISIDEHDIAKVQPGQKATIKVEALKGQEFPAEVTGVAIVGSNSGGSSKFNVELTLDMVEDMLSGMSASAVIPLEEKTDILLIPTAALNQDGARTIVYTALNEEGDPASPVEVETGLTDGEYVEVVSGLELGQKVYYSYYDTVELDTSAEAERFTFG